VQVIRSSNALAQILVGWILILTFPEIFRLKVYISRIATGAGEMGHEKKKYIGNNYLD
jgi:hypothetical protein